MTKKTKHTASFGDRKTDSLHGLLAGGINTYCDARLNAIDGPVLFYTLEKVPRSGEAAITFHIFGVEKSIAEAILIQTTRSLVSDLGFLNHNVRINSLGDKDSTTRYVRELTDYLRRRLDEMPASARELMKDHTLSAFMHLVEKEHDLAFKSPNSMEYLSDYSRKHFREIVEYLDMSQTPYEIDARLVGHDHCYSGALFAIDFLAEDNSAIPNPPLYVRGGRYNEFINRNSDLDCSAAGAVVVLRKHKAPARAIRPKKKDLPAVYLVQLGFCPKIQSLLLLHELREVGISVLQNLVCNSLSTQLIEAEEKQARYAVIMGQKEFIDGTVILRNLKSRTQDVVPISSIVNRLKRMAV